MRQRYAQARRRYRQAVTRSDRERRDYFQRFYGINDELPTHYDPVISTDVLTPAQAGDIILAATSSGTWGSRYRTRADRLAHVRRGADGIAHVV